MYYYILKKQIKSKLFLSISSTKSAIEIFLCFKVLKYNILIHGCMKIICGV